MWQRAFWLATFERAVKAFAAALISTWVIGGEALDVRGISWGSSLGVAGGAALLSLLFSVASSQVGPAGSPSLVADPAASGVLDPPAPPLHVDHEPPSHVHRVGEHRVADRAGLDERLHRPGPPD